MAPKDAAPLGEMFKDKGKLRQNPQKAAKDAKASAELEAFFASLRPEEVETLVKTWEKMDDLGLKQNVGNVTVCFL